MRQAKALVLSLIALLGGVLWGAPTLLSIGAGGYQALVSQAGQVTLVDFWATWCEPCREEMPEIVALRHEYPIRLITISCDEAENQAAVLRFLKKSKVAGPFFIKNPNDSGGLIDAADPSWGGALPALFLYNKQGKLVRRFTGEVDLKDVEAAIRGLL